MASSLFAFGIILIIIPVLCVIFAIVSNVKRKKAASKARKAVTTRTTVQTGVNGRTVFESTTTKPMAPLQTGPRSPILPFTQQQASRISQGTSLKNTLSRLSNSFLTSAAPKDDISEMKPTAKPVARPHMSPFAESVQSSYEGPVSPIRIPDFSRQGFNNSEVGQSSPVSPLSIRSTNDPSSIMGRILVGYTNEEAQRSRKQSDGSPNIPLIALTRSQSIQKNKAVKGNVGLGVARGFMPPIQTVNSGHAVQSSRMKGNGVDTNKKMMVRAPHLSKPPKAMYAKEKENDYPCYPAWI